jgi:hypothetical protein
MHITQTTRLQSEPTSRKTVLTTGWRNFLALQSIVAHLTQIATTLARPLIQTAATLSVICEQLYLAA